ncbi:PTS fructose transporter subunit IIA [Staphylococcus gallinarum]|uniref:PTS sugar transporter subunit IIA n=1 Tax=Staphylococcus TaxID=1279 RepID=UPI000D1C6A3D|nr:fructose PTS transporter subunit IIA [Staphylococcus gallinarum]MCD8820486.1 fructose PTS transporter subunit IIA [Staphylococcus gallinarum]MCD8826580.1 fructose PTS transporter subunit IIA [Staphylococcus gallinarum]PTE74790.1 PTS fructose transporter subunit IIA [Staphylococcus gallinarum]PTK90115.1 PTS fructose transporter subunit IIA [Staphylococcus gallinarum]PTL08425.1 PTS fructose transporter subunit IIA [Staphylococcus gallinarum]
MELVNILDEKIIFPKSNYTNKEETLKNLATSFKKEQYINDIDNFLNDVYNREKEGVTGIGNLLAIPHGKSESVQKPGVAIATLNKKVEWESLDNDGVQIIFLIAVGTENSKDHLKLLSQIARKLGNDEINSKLLNAQKKEEIIKILTS